MFDWNNEEQVLRAVSKNGFKLQYASPELQNNEKIVLAAVLNYCNALVYASSRLKNSRSFWSLFFNKTFNEIEIRTIKKYKLYDFKFSFNPIQIHNFKDILIEIF